MFSLAERDILRAAAGRTGRIPRHTPEFGLLSSNAKVAALLPQLENLCAAGALEVCPVFSGCKNDDVATSRNCGPRGISILDCEPGHRSETSRSSWPANFRPGCESQSSRIGRHHRRWYVLRLSAMNSEIIGAENAGRPISNNAPVISFFNISFALRGCHRHGGIRRRGVD